ncbi:DUF4183 domain-containing protein [Oscillospiraceae bacterium LTW-04]|nr:DUF4183 domain-containing protein [Oscillospiraceae bacterium MB24-C1]
MAIGLFKLVVESTLSDVQYFSTASTDLTIDDTTPVVLLATDFVTGDGAAVTTFTNATSAGYYMLEIGGVLQQTGLYTISASGGGLELLLTTGNTATYNIAASTPITLTVTESTINN